MNRVVRNSGYSSDKLAALVFLILLAEVLFSRVPRAAGVEPSPSLSSISAYLFQNKTGTLSENVLGENGRELRNSFAGENSASAALVVVEVSGPPRAVFNGVWGKKSLFHVRLSAQEMGRQPKRLLRQTQVAPSLAENGKGFLGFWLVPGGCAPVKIVVLVEESPKPAPLSADLNFSCGE